MSWHVGQKVICERTEVLQGDPRHPLCAIAGDIRQYPWPEFGGVYTIRKIFSNVGKDGLTFWLDELDDDFVAYHEEMFRPLTEQEAANADYQRQEPAIVARGH